MILALLLAIASIGPVQTDADRRAETVCRDAGARFAELTQEQSESCVELVRLALACSGPDDDYLDYVPRHCGGHVTK